ncbi:MAG: ADP-forming succinate--CoA ligase subunit beta [Thaumarchaeota archaeon]|nr:ADP-forming succinate--CoA ligase subunit beta [Candidatus Calditenuaceae archaeon]MDW8042577.1 ADP-forming succinate--CoA ligase subunit beta [Nitrososphaerota archaeon]
MKLYEHEAIELFGRFGIPTPRSIVASTPEEARRAVEELGGQGVLKAQVLVGGRGKSGGIRVVRSPAEAESVAGELLSMTIKGESVRRLLVAELVKIARELYVSYAIDRANWGHVMLASPMGGVDIEDVAARHPDKVIRISVDPLVGVRDYHLRRVASFLEVPDGVVGDFVRTVRGLYSLYSEFGCELAEINPLALTEDGRLLALDAKLIIDDNFARVRGLRFEREKNLEEVAREMGFSYVELDGNIGIICNGAGLTMATMDIVKHYGGRPANFLDIGGGADARRVESAVNLLLSTGSVKVVFVNVLGGITRCDEVASGLVKALKSSGRGVKLVVRLVGTREEEGQRILRENGYEFYRSMEEAARRTVELSREV